MLETSVLTVPETMYMTFPGLRIDSSDPAPVAFDPIPEVICADCDPRWENGL
jgi:hypothetical protein